MKTPKVLSHYKKSSLQPGEPTEGFEIHTCWVQGPERRSPIVSGLSITLCCYKMRISGSEVECGLRNVTQQQQSAEEEAPEKRLHRRQRVSLCSDLRTRRVLLGAAGVRLPLHMRGISETRQTVCVQSRGETGPAGRGELLHVGGGLMIKAACVI